MVFYKLLTRFNEMVAWFVLTHSGCMFVFGRVIRCAKMGFFASLTHLISVVVSIPVVHFSYMVVYHDLVHLLLMVVFHLLVHLLKMAVFFFMIHLSPLVVL